MKAIRWLLKLVLVIMTLPLILAVWLIKWFVVFLHNPANKDRQIGFQPTRKLGRTYKEDDLTYNRNLLGHADIEKVVSEEKIRQLSRSIMDVLWFSLWNKAK